MKKKKIKILVVYHKKDKLYKDDILTPIHVGRALACKSSKDGSLSQNDYNWLLENMIGDDTGENISSRNRELNEITAIYWAWKNYDKLGNPDYIGLNHYRRFFKTDYAKLNNTLKKYYFMKIKFFIKKDLSIYDAWRNSKRSWTDNEYLDNAIKICNEIQGNKDIETHFKNHTETDGLCNMFILPKEEFFKYCEFLFGIIFKLPEKNDERTLAMFAERLSAYYFNKLAQNKKCCTTGISEYPADYLSENNLKKMSSALCNIISKIIFILKLYW